MLTPQDIISRELAKNPVEVQSEIAAVDEVNARNRVYATLNAQRQFDEAPEPKISADAPAQLNSGTSSIFGTLDVPSAFAALSRSSPAFKKSNNEYLAEQ